MSALAGRVDAAVAGVGASERTALERREIDGAGYAAIAEELGVKREQVADLLVAARLAVAEALDGSSAPDRATKQCGPSRRVIAAQADGEAVGARDLDRASQHIESCEPCQAARVAMQEARLACRTWRGTEGSVPPVPPAAAAAARRSRLAAAAAGVVALLIVLAIALGGGDSADTPQAPAAPPVGQGSADAEAEDVVPPPGDEFCLPDEPDCP